MPAGRTDKKVLVIFEPERKAITKLRVLFGARSDSAVVRRAIRALARAKGITVEKRRFEQPPSLPEGRENHITQPYERD